MKILWIIYIVLIKFFMEIKYSYIADIRIFLPKLEDDPADIYSQLYGKIPSEDAKGSIYSFLIAQAHEDDDNPELTDIITCINFGNRLEKFSGYNYSEEAPNLSKEISKKLKIDEDLANGTILMIQGLFESEAEDVDNAPFSHKWSERYNEADAWYELLRDLGLRGPGAGEEIKRFVNFPKNRLYIRIRTNRYNDEDAKIELKDQAISFDDSNLQTALAISTIEVS